MIPKVTQIDATEVYTLSDTFQNSPKSHLFIWWRGDSFVCRLCVRVS